MGQPYGMDPYASQPGMMGSMAPGYGAPMMPPRTPSIIQPLAAGLSSMMGGATGGGMGMGGSMGMGGGMGMGGMGMGGGMGMYT